MADDGRICVDSKQSVLKIHEKLRKEVHKIAEKKSWSAEQKEEFEKKILELYKESVEETVQANVVVGGQDWNNVSQSEDSSISVVREELEPLNRDRVEQVFAICSELEDLMKDTTFKRKNYPQQITEGIKKILQSKKELLEKYQPATKSDSILSSFNFLTSDFDDCIQRLQSLSSEVSQLSKSIPELHGKVLRLQEVVQNHKVMQKSETDAVLFGRDSNSDANSLPSSGEVPISQGDQTNEQLNSKDFIWWGSSKRKSNPPQRLDPSNNSQV
ncbi:unnamed protein product [Porites evermanni]|uniref:Uncharacterized protein n=1 Tax=Porites evermanni TaxID=104178 RepID=A0ABN8N660_9CNID|nr:unnamed protein product [Porites evermanni]